MKGQRKGSVRSKTINFRYTKNYSLYFAIISLSLFELGMFIDWQNWWSNYYYLKMNDPGALLVPGATFTESPWISLLMFAPPLIAGVFILDYLGVFDDLFSSELSILSRRGRSALIELLLQRYFLAKADLNDWRSFRQRARLQKAKRKLASDKSTSSFEYP